jgi:prepilin-type N-terminal cleavage/methylation domain-containing protein
MINRERRKWFSVRCLAGHGEKGLTLIEILVALGILAAVAVVFLMGMSTSSRAVMTSQVRVTMESLAKSQLEYVKSCTYDDQHNPPEYSIDPNLSIPSNYNVSSTAERMDPKDDGFDTDDGLQKIRVTVTRTGGSSIEIVGYKLRSGSS